MLRTRLIPWESTYAPIYRSRLVELLAALGAPHPGTRAAAAERAAALRRKLRATWAELLPPEAAPLIAALNRLGEADKDERAAAAFEVDTLRRRLKLGWDAALR